MAFLLVLAIGQDPVILSTRAKILRSAGYIVREASSVAEAAKMFQREDFDLVVFCHTLPVADRDSLSRTIRSSGSRIPIYVVASASAQFQVGVNDGILPSRPDELVKELKLAVLTGIPHLRPRFSASPH